MSMAAVAYPYGGSLGIVGAGRNALVINSEASMSMLASRSALAGALLLCRHRVARVSAPSAWLLCRGVLVTRPGLGGGTLGVPVACE
jgi:hypothetical protein